MPSSTAGRAPPRQVHRDVVGVVVAVRGGRYTFGTTSDDGSHVFIDGRLVVDNGGGHKAELRTGDVTLESGVHAIRIDFDEQGGVFEFDLLWARDGAPLSPLPEWALAPREAGFGRFLVSLAGRRSLPVLQWIWVGTLLLGASTIVWRVAMGGRAAAGRGWRRLRAPLRRHRIARAESHGGLVGSAAQHLAAGCS